MQRPWIVNMEYARAGSAPPSPSSFSGLVSAATYFPNHLPLLDLPTSKALFRWKRGISSLRLTWAQFSCRTVYSMYLALYPVDLGESGNPWVPSDSGAGNLYLIRLPAKWRLPRTAYEAEPRVGDNANNSLNFTIFSFQPLSLSPRSLFRRLKL